ncbi:MAG: hypothetical protein K940chlam5_00861, partial [Candidatus Anoxychlamydiales bacterium]|nr:hypothetical protein [Candidatus Anoxychlamydiales bacterium]
YLKLAHLIQDKQQKANVYLTAANHFLKKDVLIAERFAMEAFKLNPDNPLNYFPYIQVLKKQMNYFPCIQVLKKQKKIDELIEAFLNLSNVYKRIKDKKNKRLCLREMVELKPSGQIYERITKSYLKSGKNEKSLQYFLKWIDFNISERRWNAAETIAQRALVHFKENVHVLERLEEIYNNFLGEHLQSLLFRLAKAYDKDLDRATSRYMQLWERFHNGEAYFEVAKILMNQENSTKAVKVLFELSRHSLLRSNMTLLDKCVQTILQIDPELKFLSSDQQLTFLSFSHIGKLTSQVQDLTRRFDHSQCKDIYESCAIGDIAHVEQMAKAIRDLAKIRGIIELPNEEGLNLLHITVLNGQLEIATLLVNGLKADVSKPIHPTAAHELAGLSPLDIAAKYGSNAFVELLQAGSKPFADNEKNPLHHAVENGHFSTVELLLSFNMPTNQREPNNSYTALHLAVLKEKLGIAKLLLSYKDIDPNLSDKDDYSPLDYAVDKTMPDFIRVICECNKTTLSSDEIKSLLIKNQKNQKDDNLEAIREIEQILQDAKTDRGLRVEDESDE